MVRPMAKPMAKLRADRRAVSAGDNAAASARRPAIGASGERDLTRHNGYHEIVGSSKNLSRVVENQPGRSRNPGRSREIRVKPRNPLGRVVRSRALPDDSARSAAPTPLLP